MTGSNVVTSNKEPLPPVSCMCLTYGRVKELEEAIESFLRQDYQGTKELIVLNDLSDQTLLFEHPQVRVINRESRCHSVGAKRNLCAQLATHDLLFVWDDDDVYMPHRLSHSVRQLQQNQLEFFKPDKGYYWNNGRITGLNHNLFHSQSCFSRRLFDEVDGYPDMGSGQDWGLESKIQALGHKLYHSQKLGSYFYFYRWAGVGSYHLSAFGKDSDETPVRGEERVADSVSKGIQQGKIPVGKIQLEPVWHHKYQRQKFIFNCKFWLKNKLKFAFGK